jgi:hypothetical protein
MTEGLLWLAINLVGLLLITKPWRPLPPKRR